MKSLDSPETRRPRARGCLFQSWKPLWKISPSRRTSRTATALATCSALSLALGVTFSGRAGAIEIPADGVYGQPDLVHVDAVMPDNQRVTVVRGLAATDEGLYAADYAAHRVLFFPKGSSTATRVYGQPDFAGMAPNNGGLSARSLNTPFGVAADSSGLYVADTYNNRVLHFPAGSTVADRVYGQPSFTTATPNYEGVTARTLNGPEYVAVDPDGALYVSDSSNYRVLYFPPGQTEATFVYGQPDFSTSWGSTGPSYFSFPMGVAADRSGVYVVDMGANRALYFPKNSKTATLVYGQPNFSSAMPNAFNMGPKSLMRPIGCAVDEHGLYISEYLNSRITFFPKGSTTASVVYGQPDFNTLGLNQYGISGYGFYVPWTVAVDNDHVYAADFNNRVLRFPKVLTPMPCDVAFQVAPVGATAGAPFTTQPVVVVRRSDGLPSVDFNGPVTLKLKPGVGPECGKLLGQATVNAVNGIATFAGLSIDTPGTYRLRAFALSLPLADSDVVIGLAPGTRVAGDLNKDGRFNMADVLLHLKSTAGLEVLP